MLSILSEFITEIITVVIMAAVIVAAVFAGHKFRDFMDARKAKKNSSQQ